MTLVVKIYDRVYNIRYPSERRVVELMREFATMCKGSKKPGAARRFFVCIHCGKSDFSNKLMLNVHRFEVGCDRAQYSDGTKALLLPYPDFLQGQGKLVEVMGKHGGGMAAARKRSKGGIPGEEDGDAGNEEENSGEDTEWDTEFEGPRPSKRLKSGVTEGEGYKPGSIVSPPADLFYGAAPPKTEKAASKPRKSRRNIGDSVGAETVKSRGQEVKPVVPRGVAQIGGTGRGIMKVLGGKGSSADAEAAEGGASGEDNAKRGRGCHDAERRALENREMMKGKKKKKTDGIGAESDRRAADDELALSVQAGQSSASPAVSRRPQPRDVAQAQMLTPDAKAVQKFHVKARNPQAPKHLRELKLPTKSRYPVSVWAEDVKRIASKDFNTVEETFVLAASLGAARALQEKYSRSQLSNPAVTLDLSLANVELHQVSGGTVLEEECVMNADGLKDVDPRGDVVSDGEAGYFNDDGGWTVPPGDTGYGVDPVELRSSNISLEAAMDEMTVWGNTDHINAELLQHWAQGKGYPEPFQYQPEMEKKFQAREEELQRHERLFVAEEQRKADEAMAALTIPTAPEKPPVPGLYHLQKIEGAVAVPWSWDHESGDSFRTAWEESYPRREFQEQLMGCLWWWTSKKVSLTPLSTVLVSYTAPVTLLWTFSCHVLQGVLADCLLFAQADKNLPEDIKAVRHSISSAMDLLVASRGANEAYPELDKVCAYLQWTRDYAKFLETSRDYIKRKKAEINAKVSGARDEFREKNAMLREKVIWEWCPFWRILIDPFDEIFQQLPPLPWRHDRK